MHDAIPQDRAADAIAGPAVRDDPARAGRGRRGDGLARAVWFALHSLNGAAAGGAACWLVAPSGTAGAASPALLVATLIFLSTAAAERMLWNASLLPLGRLVRPAVGPGAGVALTQGVLAMLGLRPIGPRDAAVIVAAATVAVAAGHLLDRGRGRPRRVVVVGSAQAARGIGSALRETIMGHRFALVGRVDSITEELLPERGPSAPLGRVGALSAVVAGHGIDIVVVADEAVWGAVARELAAEVGRGTCALMSVVEFHERALGEVTDHRIQRPWGVERHRHPTGGAAKRAIDVLLSGALLLLVAPVIAVLAVMVRRDGGPAFFVQERTGRFGRPFRIYKLRSMAPVPDDAPRWATRDDARITPVGALLRRTHLDELPQLYNVLRGDMSLVGPRPEQPAFVEQLTERLPGYPVRHLVRPGLTGWAQVRGGYCGSLQGSARKLRHDIYYIRHRSLAMDLMIIVETLRTLFADRQFEDARDDAPGARGIAPRPRGAGSPR